MKKSTLLACLAAASILGGRGLVSAGRGGEASPPTTTPAEKPAAQAPSAEVPAPPADRPGLKRLDPKFGVWIDPKKKQVIMAGEIACRQGPLEMFACLKGTKEHESVVAVRTKAFIVHAALLAIGAEPGSPVKFQPEYQPARGPEIEVTVVWKDAKGKRHETRAQEWVRNVKTGKAMTEPWVFGGSNFRLDEVTGKKQYQAEGGDFICVSNFPSAMLDVPVASSSSNDDLMFEAFTERIPPRGTAVELILTPKLGKDGAGKNDAAKDDAGKDGEAKDGAAPKK
ncbi:MAG: YdjY domain-containing protein [Pirellulales bacterium]